jgi:uncharacterized membrane protein
MFLTGTLGVVIGGPLAILLTAMFAPEIVGGVGPEAVWRGMTTIAGSWIGGGANQAAMYEIFEPSDRLYSIMITVDVLVAEVWMAFLLIGVGKTKSIDRWLKADASAVIRLQEKNARLQSENCPDTLACRPHDDPGGWAWCYRPVPFSGQYYCAFHHGSRTIFR